MHLNVIQFYDWMYRHDEFYPESDIYTDIMGRKGSMTAVAKKSKECTLAVQRQ